MDTSSHVASVSLIEEDEVLALYSVKAKKTHSQRLMPMIDHLLNEAGYSLEEMDAYAVCQGPGSFTGVRIAISTAKAFAQVHGKPIFGFTSNKLLAARGKGAYILSLINAQKNQVYFGLYKWEGSLLQTLEEGIADHSHCVDHFVSIYGEDLELVEMDESATSLQTSLYPKIHKSLQADTYETIEAKYIKLSQAERDLK